MTAPANLFTRERLTPSAIGLAWVLVLLAYLYQGIVPAFNADDIMQMQNPQDTLGILAAGRWGYYFVFRVLMHTDPLPLLSTVLGTVCLVGSAVLAAQMLAFRFAAAALSFILVASISVYYGDLFSYDSTRLAFPFGNLLAIAGLFGFFRGQRAAGVMLLALAPGFYPVASELAAAVLVAVAIRRLAWPLGDTSTLLWAAAALLASLVLYMLVTRVAYAAFGLELNGRTRLDPLAAIHRFHDILDLFRTHSMPLLAKTGERHSAVADRAVRQRPLRCRRGIDDFAGIPAPGCRRRRARRRAQRGAAGHALRADLRQRRQRHAVLPARAVRLFDDPCHVGCHAARRRVAGRAGLLRGADSPGHSAVARRPA